MASLPPTLIPSEKRKLVTAFRECLEVPEMNSVNMETVKTDKENNISRNIS